MQVNLDKAVLGGIVFFVTFMKKKSHAMFVFGLQNPIQF